MLKQKLHPHLLSLGSPAPEPGPGAVRDRITASLELCRKAMRLMGWSFPLARKGRAGRHQDFSQGKKGRGVDGWGLRLVGLCPGCLGRKVQTASLQFLVPALSSVSVLAQEGVLIFWFKKRQGKNCKSTPLHLLRRGAKSVNKPFVLSW